MMHDYESKTRLLAKLLRELLDSNHFECLSDLTDALKGRCSKLKIQYRDDDITGAMRVIASNRELADLPVILEKHQARRAALPEGEIIPRSHANQIYAELMARYRRETAPESPEETPVGPANFPALMPL